MKKYLLITRGVVAFPGTEKTIKIGREISINTVNKADETDHYILITSQTNPKKASAVTVDDIFTVGVMAKIKKIDFDENKDLFIVVEATQRVYIEKFEIDKTNLLIEATYLPINDQKLMKEESKNHLATLLSLLERSEQKINSKLKYLYNEDKSAPINTLDVIYNISNELIADLSDKQTILGSNSLKEKVKKLSHLLANSEDMSRVEKEISQKINDSLNKQQREFYLREKLRIVKEELGEIASKENDANILRKKLNENPYPTYIKERLESEINRLEAANPQEVSLIRNYIECLLELPWWQESKDNEDINKVKNVLDKSHYGLEKVKERIVEYLAVRTRAKDSKAPIICLVGPPGVGKSSLAKSIAESLDKVFVKVALGGMKDESEIRGHRKTYLGAMPGRIIKAMKKAGVINPLFLLDELDKMSSDMRGDPASAMLEVLDPEQNDKFSDNYVEEDYNLSKVMFVATANYADQIPAALYDRLEIIELTSYTELEKLAIAKQYLLNKVFVASGLKMDELTFSDEALLYIIRHYTREAGVRELERLIQKIARKYVVLLTENKISGSENIDIKKIVTYLDKEIYEYNSKEKYLVPGIVNGMAYTSAGGDLLQIEVSTFAGKGDIKITGNLKETMKESAEVALAHVKSNAKDFGLENFSFKDHDIHIHVPSGGIPKDGPSAGVTLTTAIISCLTNRPVKNTISMTGEITLRGKVLIIGGIKEKIISAHRGGVNEIFIPTADERFLKEVPKEVLDNVKIHLIDHYKQIYDLVFSDNKK